MIKYKELVDQYDLSPNQLYLLWCIYSKNKPSNINIRSEFQNLKNKLLVNDKGEIQPSGLNIISDILKISPKKTVDINEQYLEKYVSMFPKIKLPSGKYARVDKKNLKSAFVWFFKTYDYTWDEIIKATAVYVDEYEKKGYLYMRNSQYFICKANPDKSRDSELANYCSTIRTGLDSVDDNYFKEKVV